MMQRILAHAYVPLDTYPPHDSSHARQLRATKETHQHWY